MQESTYSSAITVPNPCDLLDVQSIAQVSNNLLDNGIHGIRRVLWEPSGEIYFLVIEIVSGQGVAVQEIRDDGQKSTCGEAVGHQLGILVDAEDVAKDDDGLFGRVVGGACEVGVNYWYVGIGSTCVGVMSG